MAQKVAASEQPAEQTTAGHSYVLRLSLVSALGGLLFGFDISVISGTIPFLTDYFQLTEASKGFAVGSLYLGCMVGAVIAGRLSDRYGRKKALLVSAVLFIITAAAGLAESVSSFVTYRIIGGVGVGMASLLSPLYIAEISPAGLRGRFVSLNQLTIVIGILMAYFSNYLLVGVGEDNWRWMLASEGAPAVLFFVLLFLVPESPRYLAKVGEDAPAIKILTRVEGAEKAKRTMAEIRGTLSSEVKSRIRDLFRPRLQRVLVIGVVLAVLQQWSGINVIFFYAPDIFTKIGVGIDSALFQTVLLGLTNLIFTFVALWLVDRTGRKGLLLVGSIGMSLCYACIGFFYRSGASESVYLLVLSVITIAFYASSLAPVTWVMISEIFPNRFRGAAMAIATLFLWIACYVLTVTFPVLVEAIGSTYTFWMYGVICLFGFLYIWRFVPETKGKSLEQLEKELAR